MPSSHKETSEEAPQPITIKRQTESSISKFLLLDSKIYIMLQAEDGTLISRILFLSVEEVEVTPAEEAAGHQPLVFKTFTWLVEEPEAPQPVEKDICPQAMLFKISNSSAEEAEVTPMEEDSAAGTLVSRTSEEVLIWLALIDLVHT